MNSEFWTSKRICFDSNSRVTLKCSAIFDLFRHFSIFNCSCWSERHACPVNECFACEIYLHGWKYCTKLKAVRWKQVEQGELINEQWNETRLLRRTEKAQFNQFFRSWNNCCFFRRYTLELLDQSKWSNQMFSSIIISMKELSPIGSIKLICSYAVLQWKLRHVQMNKLEVFPRYF